jgi:hypothetical protein
MNTLNLIKIIAAIVSVVIALVAGFIELRLNPKKWLNRWFALFFISTAMGFSFYTFYHFWPISTSNFTQDEQIIIPLMITAQLLFNFIPLCLVMTVFILEKYKKIAMDITHLGIIAILFFVMSIGYFVPALTPTLDATDHAIGLINTNTPDALFYFVNIIRIGLFSYVVFKYAIIARKVENDTKKRVQWFFAGVAIVIIGLIINLIGGSLKVALIEIFALILFDIGVFVVVKGFLI